MEILIYYHGFGKFFESHIDLRQDNFAMTGGSNSFEKFYFPTRCGNPLRGVNNPLAADVP